MLKKLKSKAGFVPVAVLVAGGLIASILTVVTVKNPGIHKENAKVIWSKMKGK